MSQESRVEIGAQIEDTLTHTRQNNQISGRRPITKLCKVCQQPFQAKCNLSTICHDSKCRAVVKEAEKEKQRARMRKIRDRDGPRNLDPKNCPYCGIRFTPKTTRQIICGAGFCKHKHENAWKKARAKTQKGLAQKQTTRYCRRCGATICNGNYFFCCQNCIDLSLGEGRTDAQFLYIT